MTDYKWKPIEPLSDEERGIDVAEMSPLYDTWRAAKKRLQASSEQNLNRFTERLVRRLSVETGILERLYDLDRGTTEVLVTQGFAEELVSRSSTNIEPSRLIDLLRDQEAAIRLVMDCVAGSRDLSKGVIHELHRTLTLHQDTTVAIDQFGNRMEISLLKGVFKRQPNNPRRPDGSVHEYCPPIHVESEMENLLRWLSDYWEADDPIVVASWFHHRFTQIHPYQDGNGRVGRALLMLVLLRKDLLPVVIDRDRRADYISSLEAADGASLAPLVSLLARLEKAEILQALSIEADTAATQERRLTEAVIENLGKRLEKRKQAKEAELRGANTIAEVLRGRAHELLDRAFGKLTKLVPQLATPDIYVSEGGPDKNNAHYYRYEVVQSAKEAGKFANLEEAHFFVKASVRIERERLVFVVSFHHVGRELSGIMEATAFAQLQSFDNSEDNERASQTYSPCSSDPFVFTYRTNVDDIKSSFDEWLDAAAALALAEYADRL
ncbi:MAG: Fic family protein [Sedimentisphaerales bacterium]|nr:Fic family protein [Sedimentisphaerales bacterium]